MSEEVKHWGYGSGSAGCLFDNGPNYGGTSEKEAAEAALEIFKDDLTERQYQTALEALVADNIYRFPVSMRGLMGADLVEIFEVDAEDYADEIDGDD